MRRAMAGYRPRLYDGPLTLIAASVDRHFGCDTADIWSGYVENFHVQRVDGDHLSILKRTKLGHCGGPGDRPRTGNLAARLGLASGLRSASNDR